MVPNSKSVSHSQTWTFFQGQWHEGNVPIMGPRTHGLWLGSTVFDGALLKALHRTSTVIVLAPINPRSTSGSSRSSISTHGWVWRVKASRASRPMPSFTSARCIGRRMGSGGVLFDPETTDWCLCIYEAPLPKPVGNAITLSPFRRPTAECAPVDAKAACLYPNCSRALIEAASRGFQNCLMLDMLGNVAEFGHSNVFSKRWCRLHAGADRLLLHRY